MQKQLYSICPYLLKGPQQAFALVKWEQKLYYWNCVWAHAICIFRCSSSKVQNKAAGSENEHKYTLHLFFLISADRPLRGDVKHLRKAGVKLSSVPAQCPGFYMFWLKFVNFLISFKSIFVCTYFLIESNIFLWLLLPSLWAFPLHFDYPPWERLFVWLFFWRNKYPKP